MDYSHYSMAKSMFELKQHLEGIVEVLVKKLRHFKDQIFLPQHFYLFGFCFGGRIVLKAGHSVTRFGHKLIEQIDGKYACFATDSEDIF